MRWTTITSPIGELKLVTDGVALTGLLFASAPDPTGDRDDHDRVLVRAAAQLAEYFAGRRADFDVPLHLAGSDFERGVWEQALAIPYGHTATYAEIAASVGQPRAARAVGLATALNPVAVIVPCHRVVGAGALTAHAGGPDVKGWLLDLEAAGRAGARAA